MGWVNDFHCYPLFETHLEQFTSPETHFSINSRKILKKFWKTLTTMTLSHVRILPPPMMQVGLGYNVSTPNHQGLPSRQVGLLGISLPSAVGGHLLHSLRQSLFLPHSAVQPQPHKVYRQLKHPLTTWD